MRMRLAYLLCLCIIFPAALGSQPTPSIRGFTTAHAAAEREREKLFQSFPSPELLRENMRAISAEPHHAGSAGSRKVAEYILAKFKGWGLNASIEEFQALMPYPTERVVELVAPERYVAALKEPSVPEDPDSDDAGQLPTFNAYSADGDVTADVVYVNYGTPEDYEQLDKLKVDVKGKIVLARYGRSWRGIKPKVAWEHGAAGCIIYSDPKDDGFYQGDVYSEGAWRPGRGVQRGSVMDMPIHPGDPLTPGVASEPGSPAIDRATSKTLLKIPVLPISYDDALPLLRHLRGPVAPEAWRGALPVTYHVGPGASKVHVKLVFDWRTRPLYDVVARIDGSEFPDQWIIHGNHHDAWVNGASDPTSGNVALMETARGLSELLKRGWKPRRTIIIASWDGEEWGLLGSTEWVEKHQQELAKKAVTYINSDSTGKGWLSMSGSHSLQTFINEVARDVPDPRGGANVLEAKRARLIEQAPDDTARSAVKTRHDLAIDALGSGSDYTAFLDYLQIASLDLGFGGDGGGGVYHSIYDSFYWYAHFSDGDNFVHSAALSRVIGTAILRLTDADVLPFEFGATATTLREYVDDIAKMPGVDKKLDLAPVRKAIAKLESEAAAYEKALQRLDRLDRPDAARHDALSQLNEALYMSERSFRRDRGLPKREWFKHLVYAPGLYTGYGVKTLPGIREGVEQGQWDEAKSFVPVVADAIRTLAADVNRATDRLKAAAK